jgi:hypothetical protein
MSAKVPESIERFEDRYPAVWDAFMQLGDECHNAGALDEKTRRLVKVALAIGAVWKAGHTLRCATPKLPESRSIGAARGRASITTLDRLRDSGPLRLTGDAIKPRSKGRRFVCQTFILRSQLLRL